MNGVVRKMQSDYFGNRCCSNKMLVTESSKVNSRVLCKSMQASHLSSVGLEKAKIMIQMIYSLQIIKHLNDLVTDLKIPSS